MFDQFAFQFLNIFEFCNNFPYLSNRPTNYDLYKRRQSHYHKVLQLPIQIAKCPAILWVSRTIYRCKEIKLKMCCIQLEICSRCVAKVRCSVPYFQRSNNGNMQRKRNGKSHINQLLILLFLFVNGSDAAAAMFCLFVLLIYQIRALHLIDLHDSHGIIIQIRA